MDLTLTDEQQAFQALVREFLDREVVPHRARWDREESVDLALIPQLGEIGILGLTVPEEWGGSAADYLTRAASPPRGGADGLVTPGPCRRAAQTTRPEVAEQLP
jgi:alkylation response protein AidB-like acyl-CoA dehydrogenase